MQEVNSSAIAARLASFGHALRGVSLLVHSQANARLHLLASVVVLSLAFYFQIERADLFALLLSVVLVWCAEAFNTAIELMCDYVQPEFEPKIRDIKDVAAGAVLLTACGALVLGVLVFLPYVRT